MGRPADAGPRAEAGARSGSPNDPLLFHPADTMTPENPGSKYRTGVPPWIFIGAVAVLFPIFAFMTLQSINRQRENSTRLLVEKGAALIRSFEAGTRSGMLGMHGSGFKLQNLLSETAQQSDIEYLLVTDAGGRILAHGDPARIGGFHGRELDLPAVARSRETRWRSSLRRAVPA